MPLGDLRWLRQRRAKMISTWRRFWRLDSDERLAVGDAAFWLCATWIAMRVLGFRRWKNALSGFLPTLPEASIPSNTSPSNGGDLLAQARATARWHSVVARHLFIRTNCLEQSTALWFVLRRRGIAAKIRFGARKQVESLEAHAWVECANVALDEDQGVHVHFRPFEGAAVMGSLPD
jgi:transglutaminase superfamily protein